MKISVFGIGYVGAVAAACLCESGHDVVAVDVDNFKIEAIRSGRSPFFEKDLEWLISKHVRSGKLTATTDVVHAVNYTQASLVCVGTPSLPDGAPDLKYINQVSEEIGTALHDKGDQHLIIIRSTLLPGTTDDFIVPILEKKSGKKEGIGFIVTYNPEFLREGEAVADYFKPTQIVIGAQRENDHAKVDALYDNITTQRAYVSIMEAEAIKYVSNCWRAHKISFANEMGRLFQARNIDAHRVMDVFCQDAQINMSKSFLRPGFSFGGSCLPKDIRALRAFGRTNNISTPVLDGMTVANDAQIEHAIKIILKHRAREVFILGMSFKKGTDDMRESPYFLLKEKLENRGFYVCAYDPLVDQYKKWPERARTADMIILSHATPEYLQVIETEFSADIPVLALEKPGFETERKISGVCW